MVDRLLAFDPGGRGIAHFFVPGGAARAALALRHAKRVLLTTGLSAAEAGEIMREDSTPPAAVHSTPVPTHAMHSRNPRRSIRSIFCLLVGVSAYFTITVARMRGCSAQKYW